MQGGDRLAIEALDGALAGGREGEIAVAMDLVLASWGSADLRRAVRGRLAQLAGQTPRPMRLLVALAHRMEEPDEAREGVAEWVSSLPAWPDAHLPLHAIALGVRHLLPDDERKAITVLRERLVGWAAEGGGGMRGLGFIGVALIDSAAAVADPVLRPMLARWMGELVPEVADGDPWRVLAAGALVSGSPLRCEALIEGRRRSGAPPMGRDWWLRVLSHPESGVREWGVRRLGRPETVGRVPVEGGGDPPVG